MAKNDTVLLDGTIDQRVEDSLPSSDRGEVFEYLVFEQLLKDHGLSTEEIELGAVDGRNDGGIDGFFTIINGHFLTDVESFFWPKTGSELEVFVITCKHHDTFKQAPLDSLIASITELFDFSRESKDLRLDYSLGVLACRDNLKYAYRRLATKVKRFSVKFVYASRGDTTVVGEAIHSRANQLVELTNEYFASCDVSFDFVGSSELVEMYRQHPSFSLQLPFHEALSHGDGYVLLVSLENYRDFVVENGKLRRYLFDSNVRDYMGLNRVNEDIRKSLETQEGPDFWSLNNGVTILSTSASVVGKSIHLDDVQIVNGLQTTESIFRFYDEGGTDLSNRSVLVKVVVSDTDLVRDDIIRATNNQTDVEIASLHATDKIQHDIEDIFLANGMFYERRKNYYYNLGHPPKDIYTPLYIASGAVTLILKNPARATGLKSRFMRSSDSYSQVFSENYPIEVWPVIGKTLRTVDALLELRRPTRASEKFLKHWRQVVSLIVVAKYFGTYAFSVTDLSTFTTDKIEESDFDEIWRLLVSEENRGSKAISRPGKRRFNNFCVDAADNFNIDAIQVIHNARISLGRAETSDLPVVTLEFAKKILNVLPAQPWKPGMHVEVCKSVGCTNQEYRAAIALLIDEGLCNQQRDGVVYDEDGNVLKFDPDRVNPDTLELKQS